MDKREFLKLCGVSAIIPFVSRGDAVPSYYRGFNISITDTKYGVAPKNNSGNIMKWSKKERHKYFYATNESAHHGACFGIDKSDTEIWNTVKPRLDKAIDNYSEYLKGSIA